MSVLSLDLVDGDVQGAVGPLAHGQGLIDAKFCCCHRLALREGRQVEAKLLPVGPGLQQVALLLHWRRRREREERICEHCKRGNAQVALQESSSCTEIQKGNI